MSSRLTYIKEAEPYVSPAGRTAKRGLFKCKCGNTKVAHITNVRAGRTKSCGCLRIEVTRQRATTHGMTKSRKKHPVYNTWIGMRDRCLRENHEHYHCYGGRGIKVCERWSKFENFRDDMFHTYKKGLQLDRIDNDSDYSLDNCRWVTCRENQRNKRNSRTYKGECVADWAIKKGMKSSTIYQRINRLGWSLEKAINTPVKHRRDHGN